MRAALHEAKKALGRTSPNPAVGAVLVWRNRIVAKGHHRRAGAPHAEIACLRNLRRHVPPDATLYVTLEPCSTHGRTGACTSELIKAGVRTVVIGALDANPRHRGRAVPQLQAAGVEVRTGILGEDCRRLNEAFNKWIVTRRPFVIAKCGMSLDGRLSRREGEPRWITDSVARRHSHQLRAQVDAILVGAETLRADNPRLTVRGVSGARQPWRVVVTRSGKLPKTARLFRDRWSSMQHWSTECKFILAPLSSVVRSSLLPDGARAESLRRCTSRSSPTRQSDRVSASLVTRRSGGIFP